MEQFSEAYKSRCIKRLKEWNAPLSGWECQYMYDVADGDYDAALSTCELCDCVQVRYVHVMHHEEYFEEISVGCVCAGIMEGDIFAAKERECEMKNRTKRKENYLKRQWRWRANGNRTLRYKNRWLTIIPSKFGNNGFGVICDGKGIWRYKGKPIGDFLTAVHAAFNIVDPPIGGRQLL